jgi:APA family basic amino acid/polyamine antiporter
VAKLSRKSQAPLLAIALQGALAIAIALWGEYSQILSYVVSVDFIFFGATATCIFVFRHRNRAAGPARGEASIIRVPGHPITTAIFVAACWLVVINTVYRFPKDTLIGIAILLAGIPAFFFWRWRNTK